MPSSNRSSGNNYRDADNAVEKFKPKTIDGCNTCPPKKSCEGPEITFEASGCLDGGGSINLRQVEDQVVPFHVDCPGNGKLTITTCESINGGGEFTANQQCGTDIELCINNNWLDRFVTTRIGNGKLIIKNDGTINGDGEFTANQGNDTGITFGVNWDTFPACGGSSGFLWTGSCWRVEWGHLAQCPNGGLEWNGNCWKVDWALWPACANGGLVWQDGCWKIDGVWLDNEIGDEISNAEIHWDQIVGKPDCFPACEDDVERNPCDGHVASGKECTTSSDCDFCEECDKSGTFVRDDVRESELSGMFRHSLKGAYQTDQNHEERIRHLEAEIKSLHEKLAKLMA